MHKIQAVRGMNDLLPEDAKKFNYIVDKIKSLLDLYGFEPIYLPLIEKTELFVRSIGTATDVVAKEMYTFPDRNEELLTLRPEGTAGCVRAALEHGLTYNQIQKLWYVGPMFRYERPQKGRYRQFYQLGVEIFGLKGPEIDAEVLAMLHFLWQELGLQTAVQLEINSLGQIEERKLFQQALVSYLEKYLPELDEDSQKRLYSNPLRIFDSKVAHTQEILATAPKLNQYLGTESLNHFEGLRARLDKVGIKYILNDKLVRGLDYYNLSVFEWTSQLLGAQATVCGGGRYDLLISELGGTPTPAFGFSIGLERLLLILDQLTAYPELSSPAQVYLILTGTSASIQGFLLAQTLRKAGLKVLQSHDTQTIKNQFKKADKSAAEIAIILGDDELKSDTVTIKFLRSPRPQMDVAYANIIPTLTALLNDINNENHQVL